MATDYDAPRKTDEEISAESLEELTAQSAKAASVELDEADLNESIELPGADLSDESITVMVIPKKADEFTCSKCFLVNHMSNKAREDKKGQPICRDCD